MPKIQLADAVLIACAVVTVVGVLFICALTK